MVIRDGQTLVPERRTVLRHGDDLLVVTPRKLREKTEERLRQVSAHGRLAQWLGEPDRRRCADRQLDRRAADHGVGLGDDLVPALGQVLEVVADDDRDAGPHARAIVDLDVGTEPAGDQQHVRAVGAGRSRSRRR